MRREREDWRLREGGREESQGEEREGGKDKRK